MPAERRTRIKFCGMTSAADVEAAVDSGADALGMILCESPRRVDVATARAIAASVPAFVQLFAVFADPAVDDVRAMAELGALPQFHGDETPEFCERGGVAPYIKAYHVEAGRELDADDLSSFAGRFERATVLVDSRSGGQAGGTGLVFAWNPLRGVSSRRRIVVSGGLNAENVGSCVRLVRPFGVDVRSGIETDGRKDPRKMRAFVAAVREADAQT